MEVRPLNEIGDEIIYRALGRSGSLSAISAKRGLMHEAVVEHPESGAILLKWFYDQTGNPRGVGVKLKKELGLAVDPFHPLRLGISRPIAARIEPDEEGLSLKVLIAGISAPDYEMSHNRFQHTVEPTVDMKAINSEFKKLLNRSRILDSYI